ncbi:undecaprenol kinase [Desulfofarcimen acetoxidans DSM 771]|uniref:Undecaprenyl-diphosphatase n=1 Tax=Desulfofarcimen acetoxidans (strain ATCC 49208 / DSM 771 / KCTC 5769 / VKM B-1644 / 5575) TaxID=485916 RepID=C8W4I1_DESAS|nr:undecaprenol kinase [Desulfofarcimen acetoxidans DSM 771]
MLTITVWQALIMGIVQGLGEFLPISSSAHLYLLPWLFNWKDPGLTFDIALHMGTLIAVVAFFWQDWLVLAWNGLTLQKNYEGRLFWYLLLATIPGAAFGFFFEEQAETVFRDPLLVGIMLIVMGIILYVVDAYSARWKEIDQLNLPDALLIGISQAFAIIPGVSRSGITMTAARFRGMTGEAAARFSFLLSTPIILGAGLVKLKDMSSSDVNLAFVVGIISSAVIGILSIKFLLQYLASRSFAVFAWYRFIVGACVIALVLIRG